MLDYVNNLGEELFINGSLLKLVISLWLLYPSGSVDPQYFLCRLILRKSSLSSFFRGVKLITDKRKLAGRKRGTS